MVFGAIGNGLKFRSLSSGEPWNIPQSTSSRLPAASTRYFEPVTVPAAPKNVNFAIAFSRDTPTKRYRTLPLKQNGRPVHWQTKEASKKLAPLDRQSSAALPAQSAATGAFLLTTELMSIPKPRATPVP